MFCAAGLVVLIVAWPKYAQRQGRLELKYRARQEVARRQVEGEAARRPAGSEGEAPPPETGELIIRLWPIGVGLVVLLALSTAMFVRGRRAEQRGATDSPTEPAP